MCCLKLLSKLNTANQDHYDHYAIRIERKTFQRGSGDCQQKQHSAYLAAILSYDLIAKLWYSVSWLNDAECYHTWVYACSLDNVQSVSIFFLLPYRLGRPGMVEVEITYKLQLFVRGEKVGLFFFVVFSFLAFLANFVYSQLLVAQSHAKLNIENT